MKDHGLAQYLTEAELHSERYLTELDELREDLIAGNFKKRDLRATERVLQIYTELCIGLAKHYLKKLSGFSAPDAYQTFLQLKEQGEITTEQVTTWRKIIGMRNALVHDYLNLDPTILERVIKEQHYTELKRFSEQSINFLHTKVHG